LLPLLQLVENVPYLLKVEQTVRNYTGKHKEMEAGQGNVEAQLKELKEHIDMLFNRSGANVHEETSRREKEHK